MTSLAQLVHRRARLVVLVFLGVVVASGAFGSSVTERLAPYDAEDRGAESARASAVIERATGFDPEVSVLAVVALPASSGAASSHARVERVTRAFAGHPDVGPVQTPYGRSNRELLSADGRHALVVAPLRPVGDERQQLAAKAVAKRLEAMPGVTPGGRALADAEISTVVDEDLRRAELIALPLIFLLSLWVFRSLVAALLPPLVGAVTIALTLASLRIVDEAFDVSVYALNLAVGLGLGLAIDYTLLLVSRYREELARSGAGKAALTATLTTAGRAILFSSVTVAGALACLLVFPQLFLRSMAIAGVLVPLLAAATALVLLAAVLALLGPRIDALSPSWLRAAAERESAADARGAWYRMSRHVMRRPGVFATIATLVLLALGLPFLDARFTSIDASVLPTQTDARKVKQLLDDGFRRNLDTPITVVVQHADRPELRRLARRARELPAVGAVARPEPLDARTSLIRVFASHDTFAPQTRLLVERLRALDGRADVLVGGSTASLVNDLQASLLRALPTALALLAGVTLLALFAMTRSILLPVKALLMSALTVVAALGTLVIAFQWGALAWLLGPSEIDGLESTQPVLLFALAFGLSTDYGVFLLSRIKEARDAGASDEEAVATGLQRTGRIVTAAALLFCVAFLLFASSRIDFIQQLGIGTAVAVIVDAMIIRALLVPSLMKLLGPANWWAPRPLRHLHGRLARAH
jgi:uncharacterized membrane protein YdfJ with MMPL/SSD domain